MAARHEVCYSTKAATLARVRSAELVNRVADSVPLIPSRSGKSHMLRKTAELFVVLIQRWMPDAFIFAALGDHVAALGHIRESLLNLGLRRVASTDPETWHEQLLHLANEVERVRGALADELARLENELGKET